MMVGYPFPVVVADLVVDPDEWPTRGGRPAALSELQALEAREMYDELDDRGKRKYTVGQISETFGVSRKTIYRHLERDNTSLRRN